MGVYTEVQMKFTLRKDTPYFVVDFLRSMLDGSLKDHVAMYGLNNLPDHPFFECKRFRNLFYVSCREDMPNRYIAQKGQYLEVSLHADLKNYDDKIRKFVNWISPYVAGHKPKQYVGWCKIEGWEYKRENIYITRPVIAQ